MKVSERPGAIDHIRSRHSNDSRNVHKHHFVVVLPMVTGMQLNPEGHSLELLHSMLHFAPEAHMRLPQFLLSVHEMVRPPTFGQSQSLPKFAGAAGPLVVVGFFPEGAVVLRHALLDEESVEHVSFSRQSICVSVSDLPQ